MNNYLTAGKGQFPTDDSPDFRMLYFVDNVNPQNAAFIGAI